MEENHLPLYDLVMGKEVGFVSTLGTVLAYDLITEQLRIENRNIVIDDPDIDQFYIDLITQGESKLLTPTEAADFRELGLAAYARGKQQVTFAELGIKNINVSWFEKLVREQSPLFHTVIGNLMDDYQEEGGGFLQGVLPPAMIFYRKLGLIGQPQK